MNATIRTLAVAATLAVGASVGIGGTSAQAQGYAPPSPPAYYYPAAGYYGTTAGTVFVPAPGYYYNVPSRYAASAPSGYRYQPSAGYRVSRGGGGPNSPPYYSGAVHSLHGRGFDSSRHGR